MKTKLRKITSVCLAVIMMLGVLTIAPISVSAAGTSASTATTCTIGSNVSGNIQGFGRDDWYKFSTTSNGYVNLSFSHDYVDCAFDQWEFWRMYLYNSDFDELGYWTFTGNEMKTIKCNNIGVPKGTYYVVVTASNNHSNLDYNFKISFTKSDYWEKELNNTISTANNIVTDKTYSGTIKDYGDNDWYKVNFNTSGNVNIAFDHDYVDCAFDQWEFWRMYLYNSSKETVGSWSYLGNEMKTITNKVNINKGTYYIKITSSNNYSSLNYNFKLSTNAPASVKLNKSSLTLGAGETYTLTKTVSPSNASTNCTWSSSNTSVATVSNGKVTAKKAGTANITVKTSNGKTATCKVTVKPAPTSVAVSPASITLGVGEKLTISENTNSGSYANASNLIWSSYNTSIATVAKGSGNKATVTAKKTGTTYVSIKTFNGKTATCKVTVKPAPTSVAVSPSSITLGVGEKLTISENTNSGSYANASNLVWSSYNTSIATVAKGSGNKATVTAKKTGTTYVTIKTFNGKIAYCKVTVKPAPKSVSLSRTSITLSRGQTYTLTENTNSGSYANASNLVWSTNNSSVATVTKGSSNKATVRAVNRGTAYITIKTYNGKTATCKVTVK